jgi:hypothetical protein
MKFVVGVDRTLAMAIAEAANQINEQTQAAVNEIVAQTAIDAFEQAKVYAMSRLDTTARQYTDALEFSQVAPGIFSVGLREEAKHLEEGYGGFDMKPGLLKNAKKVSKLGFRYRSIPMEQKGKGKPGTTRGDMLRDLRTLRKAFGDKGITKNASGKAILGKALTFNRNSLGRWSASGAGAGALPKQELGQMPIHENLSGVVKYQFQYKSGKVGSQFVVFRTVSENPNAKGKWKHPGFGGIRAFNDLENWVIRQLETKLRELFGQ